MSDLGTILKTDSGVTDGYRHIPKQVVPGDVFTAAGALLKWYNISPEDAPAPDAIARLARASLSRQLEARGFGFVILHRWWRGFLLSAGLDLAWE